MSRLQLLGLRCLLHRLCLHWILLIISVTHLGQTSALSQMIHHWLLLVFSDPKITPSLSPVFCSMGLWLEWRWSSFCSTRPTPCVHPSLLSSLTELQVQLPFHIDLVADPVSSNLLYFRYTIHLEIFATGFQDCLQQYPKGFNARMRLATTLQVYTLASSCRARVPCSARYLSGASKESFAFGVVDITCHSQSQITLEFLPRM